MSFLTAREVNLTLNGTEIFCEQISLSQQASLERPIREGETNSFRNQAAAPKKNILSINYYLTGKCPLKDYIATNSRFALSGRINNTLQFNQAYLENYRLSAKPNSPLLIQVQLAICDELSGNLGVITPSMAHSDIQVFNYNDCYFSNNDLNITDFSWNFTNTVEPIYYHRETGLSIINPDRIYIGEKEVSADFTSDSQNLIIGFTGTPFDITFTCKHPSLNITEDYSVSGFLNKKDFSIIVNDTHKTSYSISQNHINEEPKIGSINTSSYPAQNYITIQSTNLNNGFFSSNNGFSLVEKVVLGDKELNFAVARGPSYDTITGYIPVDAINGNLSIYTSKGLVIYPSQVNLNFSGITISGFWPETGNYHDTILVSGQNFHRVTQVLLNGDPVNFNVYDTTGFYNKLIVNVPDDASVGKLNVVSSLRNVSGISTGIFYPMIEITGFTPTGTWSGICVIGGRNFSGITNVYFNNIKSPNFTVNNNYRITATIPGTGAGYTKGYIKISGHRGMAGLSKTKYQPIVRITGMNLISGGIDEDIAISGIFDPDFLYSDNGGHRLSFGNEYSIFYRHNNTTLTGLIPTGSFSVARPALFEPDGVGKYPPFTGDFIQVAKPIVTNFIGASEVIQNGSRIGWVIDAKRFSRNDLVFQGKNFNYFFGTPYVIVSGAGNETYEFNNIQRNSDGTQLIVKDVRITGNNANPIYTVYIKNFAGYTIGDTWIRNVAAQDLATVATPNVSSQGGWFEFYVPWNQIYSTDGNHQPIKAIDNNTNSYAMTAPFGTTSPALPEQSGWYELSFNPAINFGAIYCKQNSSNNLNTAANSPTLGLIPFNNGIARNNYIYGITNFIGFVDFLNTDIELAETGMLQCFDTNNNIVLSTGINFTNATTILKNSSVVTGVKRLKLFRNDTLPRYLGFSDISIYD